MRMEIATITERQGTEASLEKRLAEARAVSRSIDGRVVAPSQSTCPCIIGQEGRMAYYLVQASYTAEAWAALVRKPENRIEVARSVIERLGGKLVGGWLAFGEADIVLISDMPDNVSAAALAMAVSAGSAVKAIKTIPLMTAEEGLEAARKALGTGYKPPSGYFPPADEW
jgi:uncharacterized protein with GYD domain